MVGEDGWSGQMVRWQEVVRFREDELRGRQEQPEQPESEQ